MGSGKWPSFLDIERNHGRHRPGAAAVSLSFRKDREMDARQLGKEGPQVSALGLGCMRMTAMRGVDSGEGDAEAIATTHAALDAGISFLNTGDFYGMGANEMLVGKAIRERRDQAFVSVKFGTLRSPTGAMLGFDCRPQAVKNFCSYSLRRLAVDVIDLYQPARVDPNVPIEDTIGAISDLIKEGKVRHLGVSEFNAEQLRRAHAVHPVSALEIEYSLASRFIEDEILPTARELGVGIVAYGVVTQGLLTGAVSAELPPGDVRRMFPRFQGENLQQNLMAVTALRRVAEAKGKTLAQVAIAWVLAQGRDIVPLIGMSSRPRVPENLAALDVDLTDGDLEKLDTAFAPGAIAGYRYPEGARSTVAS